MKITMTGGALHSDGTTAGLRTQNHQVIGRLIDGQFPPKWRAFFDTPVSNAATVATVDVDQLAEAVTGVSVMLGEKEALRLDLTEDGIAVRPAVGDQGDADTTVEWRHWHGKPITVGINHQWMREALTCLAAPLAGLTFVDNPLRPFLLQAVDEQGDAVDGYGHVLIPQRLTDATRAAA